jgi:O-acetyl-ADP-ribose deacetylase (regulator of RNase III)
MIGTLLLSAAVLAVLIWAAVWRTARRARRAVRRPRPLESNEIRAYQITGMPGRYAGIVCGDLRRVYGADVWVNSENTEMQMARFEEFSVSSIIRYEGAVRDETGRVIDDRIADELARKLKGRRPVPPGMAITTGSGELRRNGVRYVVHVAAVQGEPGSGFRQIREVGRCVTNAMAEVDRIGDRPPARTILFPLLGTGQGGAELRPTIGAMTGAVIDYFAANPGTHITTVLFLAYTDVELVACEEVLGASQRLAVAANIPEPAPLADSRDPAPGEGAYQGPGPQDAPGRRKLQMGFAIDVVGFGTRTALAQESVQERLSRLIGHVLKSCQVGWDEVGYQWAGDGGIVVLPSDIDPTTALPEMVRSTARCLAEDNRQHDDRIRLRMTVGVGIVGPGAVGFAGSMVIGISRMLDSAPLRAAITDHPGADLAILLSDHVHAYVIRPGYPGLPAAEFRPVDVAMKEFREPAWLWISDHRAGQDDDSDTIMNRAIE